ncbi:putative MFS transporter [Aspergillus tamarii]|uniref:Putative MFS transporter n=1 Tax=Aspergillus tamarii TaxID=41984 RepID=A0A5N6VAE8_ASPTM|nr:putative MFS transporter [Aspergillus tamarii]
MRWRRPHILWLLPLVLIFKMALAGLAVPRINLMMSLICRDYVAGRTLKDPNFIPWPFAIGEHNPPCRIPIIQSKTAQLQLYINLTSGIFSALVSPWLGLLSDRHGRTQMIALGALGAVFDTAIALIVVSYPQQMSVNILLVGAAMDGLGGSFTATQALIYSYASDCTPPHRRSVTFGLLQSAQFCGIALGPSGAAYLINNMGGISLVYTIGLLFHVIFCLVIYSIVPESLSKERQQAARDQHRAKRAESDPSNATCFSWKALNPINLIAPLSILLPAVGEPSILFPNHQGANTSLRRNIILLATMDTVLFGVVTGTSQVIIIYAEYMFDWGNVESSFYVSIVNAVRALVLLLVLPIISWFFRTPSDKDDTVLGCDILDITLIRLSIVCDFVGYIGYAFSKYSFMVICSGAIASLGSMGVSTLHSSLTKHVSHQRIGHLLGAMGLLHALARILASTLFNLIYSLLVQPYAAAEGSLNDTSIILLVLAAVV